MQTHTLRLENQDMHIRVCIFGLCSLARLSIWNLKYCMKFSSVATPKCQQQAKNKGKLQDWYVYSQSVTVVIMTVVVVGVPPVSRAGLCSFQILWWGGLYQVLCVTCLRCLPADHLLESSRFLFHSLLWELYAQSQHALSNTVRTKCRGHVTIVSPCHIFPWCQTRVAWSALLVAHCGKTQSPTQNQDTTPQDGAREPGSGGCVCPWQECHCYLCAHTWC